MQTTIKLVLALIVMGSLAGCGNLSPRFEPKQDQKIDNQNGKIGEIESIQNGFKNELFNLKQQAEIQNSQLSRVQSGLVNLQNTNDNSGIQIFSGSGGLIVGAFIIIALSFTAFIYRSQSLENLKAADLLAQQIAAKEDSDLEDNVFKAVMYTDIEEKVLLLIKKYQINN